jgi:hypothetical protein
MLTYGYNFAGDLMGPDKRKLRHLPVILQHRKI